LQDSFFPCSSGDQFRDFLYVDDLTNAIFKCLKNKKSHGQIINIGSGKPLNIKKIILLIQSIIKYGKPNFGKIKLRKDEILTLFPSIKKAKKLINWSPKFNFQNSILKTINFYRKNYNY
jgi:nucleoside-diphosphate-sugar epimerase